MRHLIPTLFSTLFSTLFLLILSSTQALAAPAPYYLWMSKIDGSRVCSQAYLGEGWQRMGGPFQDSRCRKPA
ncbi:MAG: hypothetical protein WBH99_07940 [Azovibrio sp.]|uniref:hypothetical protein n=1 Tax=Azovibrio sp. TaxID=1872673 RepID=UPI003C72B5DB